MLLLCGTIVILALCLFLIFQPFADEYRPWYFPIGFGLATMLVTLNDLVTHGRLYRTKRCHNCRRQNTELSNIVQHRFTRYFLCRDCPKKHHFLLRRGGSIISIVSIALFFVEPISAHVLFLIGMLVFYLKRESYQNRLYREQGRCYSCKRNNDTVRPIATRNIPGYFACYECPIKSDMPPSSSEG